MSSDGSGLSTEDEAKLLELLDKIPEHNIAAVQVNCATYNTYKPILSMALPLIGRIPFVGSKIAAAVTFLMAVADSVCPA